MKIQSIALVVLLPLLDAQAATGAEQSIPAAQRALDNDFCLLAGVPPADFKYTKIKDLKVGKVTYGGVTDLLQKFTDSARAVGADAIINYSGSQRFGFWPWRMVHPVVHGTAIKWDAAQKPNCAAVGGATVGTIIAENKPPPTQ